MSGWKSMGVVEMSVLTIHCRSQRGVWLEVHGCGGDVSVDDTLQVTEVSGWKSMGVVVMSVLTIHCRSQRGVWEEVCGCGGDVSVDDTLQVTERCLVGSPWVWW